VGSDTTFVQYTPDEEYVSLEKTADDRHKCYRELFSYHIDGELLSDVRDALNCISSDLI
jgi:hypothetical protein